jgi:hypothetical protein
MLQVSQAKWTSEVTFVGPILRPRSKRRISGVVNRLSAQFFVTYALEVRAWVPASLAGYMNYGLAIYPVHQKIIDVGHTSMSSATRKNRVICAHARSQVVAVCGQLR